MSTRPISDLPVPKVAIDSSHITASPTLWDRFSNWASEHKAIVYTVGAVAVVITGAGMVYYLSDSRKTAGTAATNEPDLGVSEEKKKKSKKDRRKAKNQTADQDKEETTKFLQEPSELWHPGKDETSLTNSVKLLSPRC